MENKIRKTKLKFLLRKDYIFIVLAILFGIVLGMLPSYDEPKLYALSSSEDELHCLFPSIPKKDKIVGFNYPFLADEKISVYTIETENFIIEINVMTVNKDDPLIVQTIYNLTKNNLPDNSSVIRDQPDNFEIKLPDDLGYIRGSIIAKNKKVYRFFSFSDTSFDPAYKYIKACIDVTQNPPSSPID